MYIFIFRITYIDQGKVWLRPNPSIPNILHQATMSILAQENKDSKYNTFCMFNSDYKLDQTCDSHDPIATTQAMT